MTRRVVLGVGGGIAAYKVPEVIRRLRDRDCDVTVIPTSASEQFVGAATWEALSGHVVSTTVFDEVDQVRHVRLGAEADLIVVAPATADLLAKAACGRADDLLTATLLVATCPVLFVPAMHTQMWQHPATRANVATLRSRGAIVKEPAIGRLTGPDSGPGRMPEPGEIADIAAGLLGGAKITDGVTARDLAGVRVLVTAGGTHEALDPVRYLGNSSSGRMGVDLATLAALRGADVTLVAAHTEVADPSGVRIERVVSTAEMADAVISTDADMVIMAAAPADFTACEIAPRKIKKRGRREGLTLELRQTTDILATLTERATPTQVIVGFAAETASNSAELLRLGREKIARKGCDLLVCNDVSGGKVFGHASTAVTIIDRDRVVCELAGSKFEAAAAILDQAARVRAAKLSDSSALL